MAHLGMSINQVTGIIITSEWDQHTSGFHNNSVLYDHSVSDIMGIPASPSIGAEALKQESHRPPCVLAGVEVTVAQHGSGGNDAVYLGQPNRARDREVTRTVTFLLSHLVTGLPPHLRLTLVTSLGT